LPVDVIGAVPSAIEQVSFKPYPHFSDLHPVVAALLTAFDGESTDPHQLVAVRALLSEKAASRLHEGPVANVRDARRSAAFVLAYALRSISPDGPDLRIPFTEADVSDPRTQALAERVEVTVRRADSDADSAVAAVEITLTDGRRIAGASAGYPGDGRDPRLRWSVADARDRFAALAGRERRHRGIGDTAIQLVDRLMTSDDVREDARIVVRALATPDGGRDA
jgi:2-methylcitrate dehydratase PrpD